MPAKPSVVVLFRGDVPHQYNVMDFDPPLDGILWDTSDLRGLTGLYLLVEGGVTEARLEYDDGAWKDFGIGAGDYGVLWADDAFGQNVVIEIDQHDGQFDCHIPPGHGLPPDGCKLVNGQVWCPP